MKKILVIQLKQIGDVLLSSPICNTLKTNYPDAQIDYIIYDYTFGVVENNPNINNFIMITNKERNSKKEFFKFLMKLPKYDICINVQGKLEGALITLFSGAKERISWNRKGWKVFYNKPVNADDLIKISGIGNTIDHRLALLSPLEILDYKRDLKIWIKNELENMEKFKVKIALKLTNDVSFIDRTSLNSSLEILIKNIDTLNTSKDEAKIYKILNGLPAFYITVKSILD